MATKLESDYPSSPRNDESEGEVQDSPEPINTEEETPPVNNNVSDILKRLQSTGAIVKKPKEEFHCFSCDEDFPNRATLENHLLEHVTLPSVVIDKLPSDDEELPPSGDENWSDEEDAPSPPKTTEKKTPQKIDISQIMNKTGITLKKSGQAESNSSDSALSKLSGLGFTITKNSPIKQEKDLEQKNSNNDVMQKLGKLGGLKLKLKSDGNNTNSFKVIDGLKDFKASDDEDEASGNEEDPQEQSGDEQDGESEEEKYSSKLSTNEHESGDEQNTSNDPKDSESDSEIPLSNKKSTGALSNNLQGNKNMAGLPQLKSIATVKEIPIAKPVGRPAIKQTPKRVVALPVAVAKQVTQGNIVSATTTPERRESQDKNTSVENIVVKQEVDNDVDSQSSTVPLFTGQIKSERTSPPPANDPTAPVLTTIKSEPDAPQVCAGSQPLFQSSSTTTTSKTVLLPVTKTEDTGPTIIEINGDSNDEDDDCCVVSATPAPDIKPIIPKTEPQSTYTPTFSSSQPIYGTPVLAARLSGMSTEKQHSFNWNAPDSKPHIDMLEKSADDIFESLLSSTKKEHSSLSDASEYISLDTLGPQHSCDFCNTRFTNLSLLEEHKRMTGHSQTLVAPSSSTLLPYNPSSNLITSLLPQLPVKQLAEQVGKLSGMNSGPGFTHQQNVMINIQAYPGAGGVMVPPSSYNTYPSGQNMQGGFSQPPNSMYGGQTMQGQYPGQAYMGQQPYGQQFQPPMSKAGFPGSMPGTPYSATSPLQGMQQAVYGPNSGMMSSQMGQMGPPGSTPNLYVPSSSPSGTMKPPNSNIRIQNIQTFPPGQPIAPGPDMNSVQMPPPGQPIGAQMPAPGPIRMAAGANVTGARPRMPSVRGARPSIRPGIQVHGQVRGTKPGVRMPMKRPAAMAAGPGQKRRTDMLLPGKHDNEDCQVMAMQKQRDGLPMIHSVQGAKDKLNLGSQISITKKTVNKEANAMANVLASRGISIKQKQKSRSPSPERPIPHIPNLGAGVSIKHTSKSSNFTIPEAKVGGGMLSCKICKKMFGNSNSLQVHMSNAHPQSKLPMFKCDECPASYPKTLQLQHHKRVFHNVSGPNRELGLPVVDLSQESNLKRLSSLGIYSFIPLANREQADGSFGIPVISVHNMQNGIMSSLQALGADGLLSLGPLKPLPNS